MQTFNRKKLNDEVSFPLVLNVNPFLDKDQIQNDQFLADLIQDNPLNQVRSQMEQPKPFRAPPKKKMDPKKTSTSFSTAASTTQANEDGSTEVTMNQTELEFNR